MPQRHYCDITGLEVRVSCYYPPSSDSRMPRCTQAPYTDPATGLRYHDKSVYELIKGLVSLATVSFKTQLSDGALVLNRALGQLRTI